MRREREFLLAWFDVLIAPFMLLWLCRREFVHRAPGGLQSNFPQI